MGDFDTADLAGAFAAPDREFVGFAQGVLSAWNPETFENVVQVRGSQLENLPVASGVEALTYVPGDVVMLTRWKPGSGRGAASYWIGMGGRVVFPGAGRAEQAVAFLTTSLGRAISADVFGDRIDTASVTISGVTVDVSPDWVDLEENAVGGDPSPGPSVSEVEVVAGIMIVSLSARFSVSLGGASVGAALMSAEITGPDGAVSGWPSQINAAGPASVDSSTAVALGRTFVISDLTAGSYEVEAKFQAGGGATAAFSNRSLWVMAL